MNVASWIAVEPDIVLAAADAATSVPKLAAIKKGANSIGAALNNEIDVVLSLAGVLERLCDQRGGEDYIASALDRHLPRQRDLMADGRTRPGTTKANDSPTTADCKASRVLIINSSRSALPGH